MLQSSPVAVPSDLVRVGQLRQPFGIQGWLWVYSDTDPMTNIFDYQPWWIETPEGWRTLTVKRWRTQAKGIVTRLAEVEDRNAADHYAGKVLWMSAAQLPAAGADEYYWSDLVGVSVYGLPEFEGQPRPLLGVIETLFETGANDVIVVKPCEGSIDQEQRLIPWHPSTVEQVDLPARRMEVSWGVDY
ncbi:MAG: ribosome maturation factor RimM [Pseudomonadota bacterium]|nr:ribosome maturation factor RimM [Pseudomonadota bacterium]